MEVECEGSLLVPNCSGFYRTRLRHAVRSPQLTTWKLGVSTGAQNGIHAEPTVPASQRCRHKQRLQVGEPLGKTMAESNDRISGFTEQAAAGV